MRGDILASRTTTGITVDLAYWNGENGLADPVVYIVVSSEEAQRMAEVPPDEAWNAFNHPMPYLADPSPFA